MRACWRFGQTSAHLKAIWNTGQHARTEYTKTPQEDTRTHATLQRRPTYIYVDGASVCCQWHQVHSLGALLSSQDVEDSAHGEEGRDDRDRHPDDS